MVITIECPTCTASFPVDTDKIPEAGVSARCSDCGEIFRVERPPEPEAESVEVPEAPTPEAEVEDWAGALETEPIESGIEQPYIDVPEEIIPEIEPPVADEVGAIEEPVVAAEGGAAALETEVVEEIELPYIEMRDEAVPEAEGPVDELREVEEPPPPVEAEPVDEAGSWDSLLEAVPLEAEPVDEEPAAEAGSWDSLLEAVPLEAEPAAGANVWDSAVELGAQRPAAELPEAELRDVELPDVELPDVELPDVELPDVELPEAQLPEVEAPETDLPEVEEIAPAWSEPVGEVVQPGTNDDWLALLEREAQAEDEASEVQPTEPPQADEAPLDVYIPAPGEGGVEMPDVEHPQPATSDDADDWVVVMEGEHDLGGIVIEPVGTVEQEALEARRDEPPTEDLDLEPPFTTGFDAYIPDAPAIAEPPLEVIPEPPLEVIPEPPLEVIPEPPLEVIPEPPVEVIPEPPVEVIPEPPVEVIPEPPVEVIPEPPPVSGFTFGKRDPKDKARRLARVLVSDMIMYNPERHEQALSGGTLKEDFEEEITKSWKEYVQQVGGEIAAGTTYWADALNDVLAKGQQIF